MTASWLPADPDPDPGRSAGGAPWRPRGAGDVSGRSYVVVDELDAAVAGLVVSAWPVVDGRGRLRFDPDADRRLAVAAPALERLLGRRRVPVVALADADALRQLRARPLAIGDVFGVRLARALEADVNEPADPAGWFEGDILDLTADAREAAKAQTSATLAGVLSAADVEVLAAEFAEPEP